FLLNFLDMKSTLRPHFENKIVQLFLITFLMFVSNSISAQVAVIGTGTDVPSATLYSPVYRFSATSATTHARSNIVFTAAEMATAGIPPGAQITAVEFYKANTASFIIPAPLYKMYMGNTSNTSLSTSDTWASIMNTHTEVYSSTSFNVPNTIGWVMWNVTPF